MKYLNITNKNEAVEHFNELAKNINTSTPYRTIESEKNLNVITNVPPDIYDNTDLKRYSPPNVEGADNDNHFMSFLHDGLNFFHRSHPEAHLKYEDGKIFHYNNCHDNSLGAYFCFLNLATNNNLPVTSAICICSGYISNKVPPGAVIGGAVINMQNLVIHDWHIWNKVNNFIIDLSMTKQGGVYALGIKKLKWEKAEDHVFKYPPHNIAYYGIDFSDKQKFMTFTKELFDKNNL